MNTKYLYSFFLFFLMILPGKTFSQAQEAKAGLAALFSVIKEKTSDMMTSSPVTTFGAGMLAGGACLYFGMKKLGILGKAPKGYVTQRDLNSFRREFTQLFSHLPTATNEKVMQSFSSQVGDFRQIISELRLLISSLEKRISKLEGSLSEVKIALEKELEKVTMQYEFITTNQKSSEYHLREIPAIKAQLEVLSSKVKSFEEKIGLVGRQFEMGLQGVGDKLDTFNLRVDLVKGMLTQQGVAVQRGVKVLLSDN